MESVLKYVQRVEFSDVSMQQEDESLLAEIKWVRRLLTCNDAWFQIECDENLIDACIYQREELLARYRYLLNAAKRQGAAVSPFQKSEV